MSVKNENAAAGASVVLGRPAVGGVYASLFEKINLNPVSELSALDIWQDAQAMSDATADERLTAGIQVFLECLTKSGSKVEKLDKNLIDHHIAELDYQISRQLDAVMHSEEFQAVESLWRGVKSLVDKTDFRQNVKVELLDMSKEDLRQDFEDSPEIIQSGLYKHTYIDEYDTPGGEPIAALISAYEFDASAQDVALLRNISKVSAAAHMPFIGSAGPKFFLKDSMEEVAAIKDIGNYFDRAEYIKWKSFRETDDARYIGLVMPRVLGRLPYGPDTVPVRSFNYVEEVKGPDHDKYLWTNASFAFASNMVRSFINNGWCVQIRGPQAGGAVQDLPIHLYDLGTGNQVKIPSEVMIPETREFEFANPAILLRRLNPYCARAMEGAASLCQTRAHAEILPEHWLLKLLEQGEGDLTVLARRYEWDMDALWQDLLGWLDALPRSVRNRPQLSDPLQALLQESWLIASLAGEEQIRSVHLLMALVGKPKLARCDGLWPLLTLGQMQLERLRPLLDAQSDERPEAQQEAALSRAGGDVEMVGRPVGAVVKEGALSSALQNALDKFTLDVTAKAREGKIDPVFGRDTEIRQMVDILSRRRKNNPILVGEPGVGKTALVEGLALRIAEGNVPESLKPVILRTLDLGLLQAGAGVKGEFEQRLKNVIDAVQQSSVPILLFIAEAHTIIGAGNQAGGADAANLLKPALARGELRTIAATTWSEYKQYFERDAALERRFQMVKVDEPDDDTACLMLRGLKSRYAEHHNVHITDDAVRAAVTLSRRYLTGRQLPDKAVDLLDTAAARVRMSIDTVPEQIVRLKAQLTALALEEQALLEDIATGNNRHGDRLVAIEQQRAELDARIQEQEHRFSNEKALAQQLMASRQDISQQAEITDLQQQLEQAQQDDALIQVDVDTRTVANVIADWTGVPLSSLMKDEQTELLTLENAIGSRVVGQDVALTAIAQRLRAAKTGLTAENGPQGVFLLVGPSGVGKTETALALADVLYGGEKSLITINLSEYQEPHTVSQLKGSPPGYVGYGQGGILTEAVRKRPYSVVLLDEVEKAHRDVMNRSRSRMWKCCRQCLFRLKSGNPLPPGCVPCW
ncbi:hypothetical protein VEE53_44000 [Escherichia coli]|nr:hypothetical protein VEE53_44000 [Escherichia coli]